MIISAARQSYNVNNIEHLTETTLPGFGVSCSKSAVHLLSVSLQKVDCIFVAENRLNTNIKTLTI